MSDLSIRPLVLALGAALLAACAVGPNHVRPDDPAPARFAHAGGLADSAEVATAPTPSADAEFWRGFDDPLLTQLVEQALAANHDLRIALANVDRANALARGAGFDRLPTVTGHAGAEDRRASADQAPGVPRADRDQRGYDAAAVATWELDLFGRVRRHLEAQRAEAGALAADLQAVQVAIVGDVAGTYLDLRGLQQRLRVARANADNQQQTLALVEARLGAGRGTDFDRSRARAQLETTLSRVPALEAQVAVAMHRLAVLTGQPPGALLDTLAPAKALPTLPAAPDPGTPADLLRRRPDVAAAERRLHAATARIGVATADLFPRLSLGGLIGSQGFDRGGLFQRDSETRLVALGIDWSFLDVGRVRARIAAADADAAGELARYQKAVLLALEDAENALVRHAYARAEDELLTQAADDSARAAALAQVRYQAGATDLFEVLDAQRTDLQAQDALVQGRTRRAADLVALYRALAGGWPTRLPVRESVATSPR